MSAAIPPTKFELELVPGAVKAAMKEAGAKGGELWMVPIGAINLIDDFNVRITGTKAYEAGIEELTASIMAEGFYRDKPLTGYVAKSADGTNAIFLTDGHRRIAAVQAAVAQGAEITDLPVLVKPPGTSMEDLTVALTKTGQPLTPYETAIVVKRLVGFNLEPAQIATRLGITKRYIDDLLLLIGAPAKVRKMVMDGKVSATEAIKTLRANPATAAEMLGVASAAAASSGKVRATGKDVKAATKAAKTEAGGEATEVPETERLKLEYTFSAKAGSVFKLAEIQLFRHVAGGTWFELSEKEGEVQVVQDIKIALKMTRTPRPTAAQTEAEKEAADL